LDHLGVGLLGDAEGGGDLAGERADVQDVLVQVGLPFGRSGTLSG